MDSDLSRLGWNACFQSAFSNYDNALIPGRVVGANREQTFVHLGNEVVSAWVPGSLRARLGESVEFPTVGDWVGLEPVGDARVVAERLPRKSLFVRGAAGKRSRDQAVAANFDYLFLMSGLDGDFNPRRIQRYLTLAWSTHAQPVVVLNKSDLRSDIDALVREVTAVAPSVAVRAISTRNPDTLSCLSEFLGPGSTVALLGSSGVGKSSLINALLGEERLATQTNRESDGRGRHTTTWRELLLCPQGGALIDLPGMRELQMTGDPVGLRKAFSDVAEIATRCRFRDCRHEGEPGCAIAEALSAGELDADRYEQFLKLKGESIVARGRRMERAKKAGAKPNPRAEKERLFREIGRQRRKDARSRSLDDET